MAEAGIIIPEPTICDDDISDDIAEIEEDEEMEVRPNENSLIDSLPSMVSITRVPKPKPPPSASSTSDTTAGTVNKMSGGSGTPPPPLLRLGGASLPPMPRLKLGGVRPLMGAQMRPPLGGGQVRPPVSQAVVSMANMVAGGGHGGQYPVSIARTSTTVTVNLSSQEEPTMPIIAGTVSLHKAVPKPGILQQKLQGIPMNQRAALPQHPILRTELMAKSQQQQAALRQQAALQQQAAARQAAARQQQRAPGAPSLQVVRTQGGQQVARPGNQARPSLQQQQAAAVARQAQLNKQQLAAAQQLAAQSRLLKQKQAAAAVASTLGRQQTPQRPVQVRTVFVPPPMNNIQQQQAANRQITVGNQVVRPSVPSTAVRPSGAAANIRQAAAAQAARSQAAAVATSGGKAGTNASSFPLNIPNPAKSGITITPLTNGKTAGVTNGAVAKDIDYEDVELDEDEDEIMEYEDDEYNEITEAPTSTSSVVPIKNLLPNAPSVSGSVTLHRLLNKKPDEPAPATSSTITVPVPLPVQLQPKPIHQLMASSLNQDQNGDQSSSSSSGQMGAGSSSVEESRRTSLDSVASVASNAASLDSTGQPRAKKSAKTSSRTSSPMLTAATDVDKKTTSNSLMNGRLGSVDSNNSEPDSLKRDRDSVEYDSSESSSTVKKFKSSDPSSVDQLVSQAASFGTHFMSSLLSASMPSIGGQNKSLVADRMKVKERRQVSGDQKISGEEDDSLMLKGLCTCEAACIPVPGKEGTLCQAVEVFGGYRVGCKNKVKRGELVKTSVDSDPVLLCDMHRDRLQSHSCCPLCGEFCSHGLVFMCRVEKNSSPHLFHRFCYQTKSKETRRCPHCSSQRPPLAVQLKLSMSRTPLKILNMTAKMTATPIKKQMETERWEVEKKREASVNYTLPSGKIISGFGLPNGLEVDKLEAVLKEVKAKTLNKATTRNMYQPTMAGDNVKLLQLLAIDYSPRQKFPEARGGTPLHVAAEHNHVLTTHILVQAGAEINALDDKNETPLMIAAIAGHADVVRYLMMAGADASLAADDGMTALHYATQNGHVECAHVILSHNKLPRNFINVKDDGGWTPLVWACEHRHEGVIRYLLEQGADPHVMDVEMNISLHWAAFSGSRSITDLLLSAGCNVNQANAIGETPIHIALRQDHYECALLLLARGARLDLPNSQGQLPATCMSGENPKIESLINLGTTLHKLMKERQQKFLSERTVVQDISNGKENLPICAVNGEDFEMGPSAYTYVKNPVVTGNVPINRDISTLQHCKCKDDCVSEDTCKCADNSTKSWYDKNGVLKEGFDFQEPPMIFECNEMCDCNQNSCNNRVVQHGITARMQVYKTYGMGWGAKAMVDIPKGGFVCEYVGEIISDAQAEQRENDSYLFDLENREGETFCLDANKFGNVARFINHSCNPNLVPVKVFTSHQDLRFPHIAFFASKDIKKGDVLGFDYGEKFWVIKHKFFTCWCGGDKCKYSKGTIGKTLQEYYKKMEETAKSQEEEEPKQQTGKLKLKLRMEEGKVVRVDDSGLLPDEPDAKKSPKREDKGRRSPDGSKGRKSPDGHKKSESKKLESKKSSKDIEPKKSPKDLEPKKSSKDSESKKSSKDLEPKKSPKEFESTKSSKELEPKKSPKDLEPKKSSELKKNSGDLQSKKSPKNEIPTEEKSLFQIDAQYKEDRKSPVIKINKSAIMEYHKAKEEKKALKAAAREKKNGSKSCSPEPNQAIIAAEPTVNETVPEQPKAKEVKETVSLPKEQKTTHAEIKPEEVNKVEEITKEEAAEYNIDTKCKEEPMDTSQQTNVNETNTDADNKDSNETILNALDDNDSIDEPILEATTESTTDDDTVSATSSIIPEVVEQPKVVEETNKRQSRKRKSTRSTSESVNTPSSDMANDSAIQQKAQENPVEVKSEETETRPAAANGRTLRQVRQKTQQASPSTTPKAKSNETKSGKAKGGTAGTPSSTETVPTKPLQTVNVSVAEEVDTITESSHAESKAAEDTPSAGNTTPSTTSVTEEVGSLPRRGRTRLSRRGGAGSASQSPAPAPTPPPASTTSAPRKETRSSTPVATSDKAKTAASDKSKTVSSDKPKAAASQSTTRTMSSERPKRTRKSLADSKESN